MATDPNADHKQTQHDLLQHAKRVLQTTLSKLIKRALRGVQREQDTLNSCLEWPKVHHEAMLLQSQLYRLKKGARELIVADWEDENRNRSIILNPQLEPHVEVAQRFKRSRKLKAGIPHHQRMLQAIQQELQRYQQQLSELEAIPTLESLYHFQQHLQLPSPPEKKEQSAQPALPYREFQTASGLKIWVGKSANANDKLTFQFAKGSDWWLHVNGFSGSHVIIRVDKGQEPDTESLEDAIQLALFFSKAQKQQQADVCITQRKFVSRFGKKSGQVHISKHRIIHAKLDLTRIQKLRSLKSD